MSGHMFTGETPAGKSKFSRTCSLLSHYLKEKRNLNLGISIVPEMEAAGKKDVPQAATNTTMDLLTTIDKPGQNPIHQTVSSMDVDPFPCTAPRNPYTMEEPSTSKPKVPRETKAAPMTIFYGGKVMVFDEFPADKARAIMLLASRGGPQSSCGVSKTTGTSTNIGNNIMHSAATMAFDKDGPNSNSASDSAQRLPMPQPDSGGSGLPIARRSSLHRFLDKRKDRAIARAPYQVRNPPASSSKNGGESSTSNREYPRAPDQEQNPFSTSADNGGESSSADEEQLQLKL